MERRERPQPQYLQIEGPVVLENGQDFYDQPPFNVILSRISEEQSLDQSALKGGLTTLAKELAELVPQEKGELLEAFRHKAQRGARMNSKVNAGVMAAVDALESFPQWDTYISEKLMKNTYKKDGSFYRPPNSKDQSKTPSYGTWLERRMERNARIQNAAVRSVVLDAFPQDLQQKSLPDAIASTGVKPARKRWHILKASGNIHSK